MRKRLKRFFPIVLIALVAQFLAPIAAGWAAAIAVSDPFGFAEICHSDATSPANNGDQGDDRMACDACQICCAAQVSASFDTPQVLAFTAPHRQAVQVVWCPRARDITAFRAVSNAQARAPPSIFS